MRYHSLIRAGGDIARDAILEKCLSPPSVTAVVYGAAGIRMFQPIGQRPTRVQHVAFGDVTGLMRSRSSRAARSCTVPAISTPSLGAMT
jgi:hypothetical protein